MLFAVYYLAQDTQARIIFFQLVEEDTQISLLQITSGYSCSKSKFKLGHFHTQNLI